MARPLINSLFPIFFIATIGRTEKEAFHTPFITLSAWQDQTALKTEV